MARIYRCDTSYGLFRNGWRETLYYTFPDGDIRIAERVLVRYLNQVLSTRETLFPDSVLPIRLSVSRVDDPTITDRATLRNPTNAGFPTRPYKSAAPEPVWTAFVVAMFSATRESRFFWLRGLPDSEVGWDASTNSFGISPGYQAKIAVWWTSITSSLTISNPGGPGTLEGRAGVYQQRPLGTVYSILSVSQSPTNPDISVIRTVGPNDLVSDDLVKIKGVNTRYYPCLRGKFRIVGKDVLGALSIKYRLNTFVAGTEEPKGKIFKTQNIFFPFVVNDAVILPQIEYLGIETRDTGRQSDIPRGRASSGRTCL